MNQQELDGTVVEKKEPPVVPAGLVKRVFAAILDAIIALIMFIFLLSYVIQPIGDAINPNFSKNLQKIDDYSIASNLGKEIIDEKTGERVAVGTYTDEDSKEYNKYLEIIVYYYEDYCASEAMSGQEPKACSTYGKTVNDIISEGKVGNTNLKDYIEKIEKDENDKWSLVITEKGSENGDELYWSRELYSYAQIDFANSEVILPLVNSTNTHALWLTIISVALATSICYLIIPLCTKNGKTIGKIVFKLCLVNNFGYKIRKIQIVFRFLAFAIINIIFGLVTVMLLPLGSFILAIFTKKHFSFHDYLTATMVIDETNSFIYNNQKDFDDAQKREEENEQKIIERRTGIISQKETDN